MKKKKRLKKWVYKVIFLVSLLTVIFASYKIYTWYRDGQYLKTLSQELEDIVEDSDEEDIKPDTSLVNPPKDKNSDYYYYMKYPFLKVNFDVLRKKNSDTVGYIKVNNTNINYPIVYSGDNSYYLSHAYDKSPNSAGWVFLDYRNNLDSLADNTVVYGHGRKDATVFGSLKNVLNKSWQENKDNYVIKISTPKYNYLFQIFSVYSIKAESYYLKTSFINKEEHVAWLEKIKSRNESDRTAEVSTKDKILTLSTCKNDHNIRIVVHAKLIAQEKRNN